MSIQWVASLCIGLLLSCLANAQPGKAVASTVVSMTVCETRECCLEQLHSSMSKVDWCTLDANVDASGKGCVIIPRCPSTHECDAIARTCKPPVFLQIASVTSTFTPRGELCDNDEECNDGIFCNSQEVCMLVDGLFVCGLITPPSPCAHSCLEIPSLGGFSCFPQCGTDNSLCELFFFCSGIGTCVANECTFEPRCLESEVCNEGTQTCDPIECISDADCDNGNFCDGTEQCLLGEHNFCINGFQPCDVLGGQECSEEFGTCLCRNNTDCDDFQFCNGESTCNDLTGLCSEQSGNPCNNLTHTCDELDDICVPLPIPTGPLAPTTTLPSLEPLDGSRIFIWVALIVAMIVLCFVLLGVVIQASGGGLRKDQDIQYSSVPDDIGEKPPVPKGGPKGVPMVEVRSVFGKRKIDAWK